MINHFRTLLGNVTAFSEETIGDEYVPRDYVVRRLPKPLNRIREALFGMSPDRGFINQRLFQYMKLLHATELAEYVLALDSRVTYLPLNDEGWFRDRCKLTINKSGPPCRLFVNGQLTPDNQQGRAWYRWRLSVVDATTIRVRRRLGGYEEVDHEIEVTRGLASAVPLPGSSLTVRLGTTTGGDADLSEIVGATIFIDGLARVSADLSAVTSTLDDLLLGSTGGYLFGGEEPYKTFRNLWLQHPHMPYRLGGLLAAYVYRVNSLVVTA